jgi:hypothetical protein
MRSTRAGSTPGTYRRTHDPEPQATPNDTSLTTFRLAVDHPRRQLANFITVKTWGRLGEVVAKHLARGRRVAVCDSSGPITTGRVSRSSCPVNASTDTTT